MHNLADREAAPKPPPPSLLGRITGVSVEAVNLLVLRPRWLLSVRRLRSSRFSRLSLDLGTFTAHGLNDLALKGARSHIRSSTGVPGSRASAAGRRSVSP